MRPGNDFTTPDFGGDIKFTSGPFATTAPNNYSSGTGNTRAALDTGVNIISALFGSYSITGGSVNNVSPVQNVGYGSQVSATDTTLVPFRTQFLGVNTDVSTDIIGSNRLIDYSQKMVNQQTQDLNLTKARIEDQQSLRDILETRLNNESGVNLDEELSRMIVVQTAFSASARVVEAVDNLFQELINAVR